VLLRFVPCSTTLIRLLQLSITYIYGISDMSTIQDHFNQTLSYYKIPSLKSRNFIDSIKKTTARVCPVHEMSFNTQYTPHFLRSYDALPRINPNKASGALIRAHALYPHYYYQGHLLYDKATYHRAKTAWAVGVGKRENEEGGRALNWISRPPALPSCRSRRRLVSLAGVCCLGSY
jgi:hypothetical protein